MAPFLRVEALSRWEDESRVGGALRALLAVCVLALIRPIDFFKALAQGGANFRQRMVRALLFAVVMGYLKFFCDAAHLYGLVVIARKGIFPADFASQIGAINNVFFSSPLVFIRPLVVFLLTLAAVFLRLKLIFGARRKLVAAFLAVCYASAAQALCLVPVIGGILSSVWAVALLTVGIRELYRLGVWQAVFAAVFLPFVILLFSMLALGPSLNQAVVLFYPEAQPQLVRMNDGSAYVTTRAVIGAAEAYKKELGFYPANFDGLKKYMPASALETFGRGGSAFGYFYQYLRSDDGHFTLEVVPREPNMTGSFKFYADESGVLRLDGPQGRVIRDDKDFESVYASRGTEK
jgi:hypothetical protein